MSPILLAGLIAGWFATTALRRAARRRFAHRGPRIRGHETGAVRRQCCPGPADQGLTLNLRGVTVQALTFLSEKAGFTINRQARTIASGMVDLVSDTPMNKDEIVDLFNKVLADHDLAAIPDRNT